MKPIHILELENINNRKSLKDLEETFSEAGLNEKTKWAIEAIKRDKDTIKEIEKAIEILKTNYDDRVYNILEIDLKHEFETETGQGIGYLEGKVASDNGTYNDSYVEWLEDKISNNYVIEERASDKCTANGTPIRVGFIDIDDIDKVFLHKHS